MNPLLCVLAGLASGVLCVLIGTVLSYRLRTGQSPLPTIGNPFKAKQQQEPTKPQPSLPKVGA